MNFTQIMIQRFNLSKYVNGMPMISISVDENTGLKNINISLNLKFNIKNVLVLNEKLHYMCVVMKDVSCKNYRLLQEYSNTTINKVYIYKDPTSTKDNILKFMGPFDVPIYLDVGNVNGQLYTSLTNLSLINSINKFTPYNLNESLYRNSYHFEMTTMIDVIGKYYFKISFYLNSTIKDQVFVKRDFSKELDCDATSSSSSSSKSLYAFKDTKNTTRIKDNYLQIAYVYMNVTYELKVANTFYYNFVDSLYLICVADNQQLKQNLSSLESRLISTNDTLKFIIVSNQGTKLLLTSSNGFLTIIIIFITTSYFLLP